jgi:hypothetical protein
VRQSFYSKFIILCDATYSAPLQELRSPVTPPPMSYQSCLLSFPEMYIVDSKFNVLIH